MQERSSSTSHVVTVTSTQISPSIHLEQSSETKLEANEPTSIFQKEQESLVVEMDVQQDDDLLSTFLHPPVLEKCCEELQVFLLSCIFQLFT